MHNPKLPHWLHRIDVPTWLIWGESDGVVTPTSARAYQSLIPGSELRIVSAAGHRPHVEQADAFDAELRAVAGLSNRG